MSSPDVVSRMLAAERAVSPPAGVAEAGLERVLVSLAAQVAPLPVAVGSLKLGWSVMAKLVGVGFVVGVAGAGLASNASSMRSDSPALASPSSLSRPGQASTAFSKSEVALPPPALSAAQAPTPSDNSGQGVAVSAPAAVSAPSAGPTFDEELRLITAAKRELDQGRPHLARVWLDEHRQRFPGGVFGLEREGLLVLASCNASPNPALARDFATRHPDSPMLGQLLRRCGAEGSGRNPAPAAGDFVGSDK